VNTIKRNSCNLKLTKKDISSNRGELRDKFSIYYSAVNYPIIVLDHNSSVIYSNPFALKMLELSESELLNTLAYKTFKGFCSISQNKNLIVSKENGLVKRVDISLKPIRINEQEYTVCNLRSNTDSIADKLNYKDLLETVPAPTVLINTKGTIIQSNAIFNKYIGFDYKDIQGSSYNHFIPERLHKKCSDAVKELITTSDKAEVEMFQFETIALKSNKEEVPVIINIKPFKTKGEILFIFSLVDISNEEKFKQLKEVADHNNALKSTFLANMSHEIRTPLAAITGFSELIMLQPSLSLDKRSFYLSLIQKSGKHLSVIIDDILDLSKIESGNMILEHIEFNLKNEIKSVIDSLSLILENKKNTVKLNVDDNVPDSIISDPTRLKQVFYNLFGNANKFTKNGTIQIDLGFNKSDKLIVLNITDTGCGINKKCSDKIFQPFSQADNSTTRYHGGTGLGLSLSRKLASLLGGNVRLVSSTVDRGSKFEFTFSISPKP